ncbi:hypothetical protein ACQ4M4_04440 [Leptolyngbya sp. AN02str]|uniref:hypothetical protein n=1 Tax=Leptolyngbya sp. AN02str TaxID=3423363 RepID=UPI003D32405F
MSDRIFVRLLLGVLGASAIEIGQAQAQSVPVPEQGWEERSSSYPCTESGCTKQSDPPQLPPPASPSELTPIPPILIPPSPAVSLPLRRLPLIVPGSAVAGSEAAQRIFLLSPVVAAYADAGLPQAEAALMERLRQQVTPDSRAEDLVWASLFDAYVDRQAYPQAIAAFNQMQFPPPAILRFVESIPTKNPNPQLVSLLPTLKQLVDQHLQASGRETRAALIRLMTLYDEAGLQTESRAIAQQLRTLEAESLIFDEHSLTTEFVRSASMDNGIVQQLILQSAEIAALAGETDARDRILQHLVTVATSAQFRQRNTASVNPDPTERERGLGEQALFLIGLAQQLLAANQPDRALPLLDQAAQWLQQRPNFPFYQNSQAKTLILAYTTAQQPAPVLRLLQALSPNSHYQNEVLLQVVEEAAATGQDAFAVQVAQQPFASHTSFYAEATLRRLAAAGQVDVALALVTNLVAMDQEQWIPLIAESALQANRPDIATTLVERPLQPDRQPPILEEQQSELAAQLREEAEFTTQMTRWLDIALELIEQEQTPQAQEILQRVHQQLEAWEYGEQSLLRSQPLQPWFTLAERYAQAGQSSQAIALLNRLWQQEQQMVAAQMSSNQPGLLTMPVLPPVPALYFPSPSAFTFRRDVPSLAFQVMLPVFRPSLPIPQLVPIPSPAPQSAQPSTQAIAHLSASPLKLSQISLFRSAPTAQKDNSPVIPNLLHEFRRADYSRHYLKVGEVARAWELFNSISENMKPRLAGDLLTIAITSGQADVARQMFPLAYPSAADGEDLALFQAQNQIAVLIKLSDLYIESMDSENARQVLQQAEAIAWTVSPSD